MKSCTNFQTYISIFQRMHHTFFILGFFKGKLAKNEPKLRDFQNLPKTRPKMMFMWNKCLFHHFWGYLATKSGVRFRIWASKVPFFGSWKRPILVILGAKYWTSDAQIWKRRPLFGPYLLIKTQNQKPMVLMISMCPKTLKIGIWLLIHRDNRILKAGSQKGIDHFEEHPTKQ